MEFAPFYIGQRVVVIESHPDELFKKGDEFIITDIKKGLCKCNNWNVQIGEIFGKGRGSHCTICNTKISSSGILWFFANRFAPIEEKFESISLYEIIETETALISKN